MEEEGGRIWALHTWTVIKVQQVLKPLLYHVWMWSPCAPPCIYFCPLACWLGALMVFTWRTLWESLNPYFLFSLFLSIFAFLSSLFRSHLINRGAIRREGDVGESWGCPEPHSGRGSHCCGDIKRVHFHPTYGFGL